MSSFSDITEAALNELFDKFSKEQMRLLGEMKAGNTPDADKDIQKQMTLLNTLATTTLRYRNLKKQMAAKINL
jgi:hypothetical protein